MTDEELAIGTEMLCLILDRPSSRDVVRVIGGDPALRALLETFRVGICMQRLSGLDRFSVLRVAGLAAAQRHPCSCLPKLSIEGQCYGRNHTGWCPFWAYLVEFERTTVKRLVDGAVARLGRRQVPYADAMLSYLPNATGDRYDLDLFRRSTPLALALNEL